MPKLGTRTLENDARRVRVLLGYSPAPVGTVDHGSLIGLTDDDHSQYVHLSAARTITAQHAFSPASAQPPFTLGANAQGQLVTGLRADELNKSVTAGAGLTGGGTLTGAITLTVGAGDGITVNANDVAVRLETNSGLTLAGGGLTLGTPGAATVSSSNAVSTSTHTHAVTSSSNPGAAASLLASNASGYLQLNRLGAGVAPTVPLQARLTTEQLRLDYDASNYASFTVGSGGNLTLAPTGDFVFDPTGNDILPGTGYDLNLGSLAKKYLTLHAAELWVETLVAQDTIATIGGRVVVAPTTTLIADCASGDATLDVKHNQLSSGDRVWMQADGKFEFMAVTSAPTTITGGYRYSVTRNLDGTGANAWYAGDAVVNTGTTGSGFIDLYSLESVNGRTFDYMYQDDGGVFSSNLASLSNFSYFPAAGAVNDAFYWGVAGTIWTTAYLNLTTAGVYTATITWEFWNGATWTAFVPLISLTSTGQKTLTLGTLTGWATTSVNGATAYWVRARLSAVTSWTTSPAQGGKRVIREKSQFGPTIVGWTRNSSTFNDLSEAWAIGNLNGLYGYGVDTYGVGLGKYQDDWVTIEPTNGIRMFANNSQTVGLQADGDVFLGSDISSPGTTYLSIFTNAQTYNSESMGAGDMLIGDNSASKANLLWDESEGRLKFRGGTANGVIIDTDGSLYMIQGSSNPNKIRWETSGGTVIAGINGVTAGSSNSLSFEVAQGASSDSMSFTLGASGQTTVAFTNSTVSGFSFRFSMDDTGSAASPFLIRKLVTAPSTFTTLFQLDRVGGTFINDTANANMTVGLTINQGANDDEILAFKSSDVAHGITSLAETDTYGALRKQDASTGGARLTGLAEDVIGLALYGIATNDDTARATTANGAVIIRGSKKSGTTEGAPGANANLLVVKSATNARFIVDQEGDIHMDATSNINAWDAHNDIELLAGVREAMGVRLAEFVESARPVLERTGVVKYNPDGHHFISLKSLHALEIDAMRQLYQRILRLEKALGLSKGVL